jgi:subfamily B ATP-binding cassette protein HlyB/CyaB
MERSPLAEECLDCGLACLVTVAYFHGIAANPEQLVHRRGREHTAFSATDIVLAARSMGLKARFVSIKPERLASTPFPALMLDRSGRHFILAGIAADGTALIQEGGAASVQVVPQEVVLQRADGRAILFASRASLTGELARFDFTWFIPSLVKYRRFLIEVLVVSAVLQLIGLVSPLMFQVVMDKVLVNRAFNTLTVVCAALFITAIAEAVLTGIRNYVLAHTATRIDVELGARLFRHLLNLPLGYFGVRRAGDTITRVRELENIRNFLTGQALTSCIDLFFSIVIIGVMFTYSTSLTLVVICSLPVYAIISAVFNPLMREKLDRKFARYSDNQSFLVEAVTGIETVKAMAIEPQFVRRWDQQLAAYVSVAFQVATLGNIGQQLIQLVGKLVTLATLFLGAKLVVIDKLTVGGLIAFNMMSQRVASPVLRLAQLWQDFQQIGISMQRLGDVLNVRTEGEVSRQSLPTLRGAIEFTDVRFRYTPDGPMVIDGVSFRIEPGQILGVVGRSGSGKSTLAKLLQRLYVPEHGRITVDGHDVALADPAWLRRQMGVVSQENLLFNRSIRDNIAIGDPGIALEAVIQAARLAGIHEVIADLQRGYDTLVGEQGTGLSGGQRQRIAIARALVRNPRVLVFDEATSALDYETERVIQDNMQLICKGRTVLIIAHRLTAVRRADYIVAMDRGQIVEMDCHDALMQKNGYYASLASLQAS